MFLNVSSGEASVHENEAVFQFWCSSPNDGIHRGPMRWFGNAGNLPPCRCPDELLFDIQLNPRVQEQLADNTRYAILSRYDYCIENSYSDRQSIFSPHSSCQENAVKVEVEGCSVRKSSHRVTRRSGYQRSWIYT